MFSYHKSTHKDKKSGFAARLRRARSYFRFSLPMCISTNGRKICTGIISIFLIHRDAVSYETKKSCSKMKTFCYSSLNIIYYTQIFDALILIPGPIVDEITTLLRYVPLAAAGLALMIASIRTL